MNSQPTKDPGFAFMKEAHDWVGNAPKIRFAREAWNSLTHKNFVGYVLAKEQLHYALGIPRPVLNATPLRHYHSLIMAERPASRLEDQTIRLQIRLEMDAMERTFPAVLHIPMDTLIELTPRDLEIRLESGLPTPEQILLDADKTIWPKELEFLTFPELEFPTRPQERYPLFTQYLLQWLDRKEPYSHLRPLEELDSEELQLLAEELYSRWMNVPASDVQEINQALIDEGWILYKDDHRLEPPSSLKLFLAHAMVEEVLRTFTLVNLDFRWKAYGFYWKWTDTKISVGGKNRWKTHFEIRLTTSRGTRTWKTVRKIDLS